MIINLLDVKQFITGLMTSTIFQGHRYVKNISCKLFLDLCTVVLWCMVATHIKKFKHSMLCVTGVYLRDITNIIFAILLLNVSHLSVCSSCLVKSAYIHAFTLHNTQVNTLKDKKKTRLIL